MGALQSGMTEDMRALLMAHASSKPGEWEAPVGFVEWEREALLAQVRTIARRIEERLSVPVAYDDGFQDASCVAALGLKVADGREAVIRFSRFGRMAVVFRWAEEARLPLRTSLEPELLPLVEQRGFRIIPPDILARPYDGLYGRCSGPFNDPMTWFERYFDYL